MSGKTLAERSSRQSSRSGRSTRCVIAVMGSLVGFIACTEVGAAMDVPASSGSEAAARCQSLAVIDFSRIEDAPTQVQETKVIEANEGTPAYCRVEGYVSPTVGFELRLPIGNWNGKFFEVGCGGFCGTMQWTFWCPLNRGYACIVSNLGHEGSTGGKWGYNNLQGQIDFGYRGAHVAAVAGKAITERFYGRRPTKSYFQGCSSGGQQALSEAQRYPWDFDGILAGAPSPTFAGPMMNYIWAKRALVAADGKPLVTSADMQLLHDAALAKCAVGDGAKHGFIDDPFDCKFDPSELLCKPGRHAACLTTSQVQAVKKVYVGPTTSHGIKIYTGGPLPGSELNWVDDGEPYATDEWAEEYFRYIGFVPAPGPTWNFRDFDFDHDYKRLATADVIFGGANFPDLRNFKAAGGKLLLYQGLQDQSDIPTDAIDYYETTERTMGGLGATQEFFRMFLVPGMDHCVGGAGAYAIDYVTYLEKWVERGQPPDVMIGAHVLGITRGQAFRLKFPLDPAAPVSFTRPVYPYPLKAKYKGTGDPDNAVNFGPTSPDR